MNLIYNSIKKIKGLLFIGILSADFSIARQFEYWSKCLAAVVAYSNYRFICGLTRSHQVTTTFPSSADISTSDESELGVLLRLILSVKVLPESD